MLSDHLLSFAENRRERYTVERIDRMKLYSILIFFFLVIGAKLKSTKIK